ncbi:DUF2164 domain-containing protein [Virgibacillus salinus]|uniref:Uncharacterized conserved protein, DUF2164 family n=1 Tax=Virgibacillus salinus TaxID=553311 RepID=A0A1H0Z378_9BACI|nr:DUF2164 domain-containing protein [Virgibacillus salinus]SDQ21947.1 Uncharacterized conserved protein, DUF2164 family [Virgibacillus salinus]
MKPKFELTKEKKAGIVKSIKRYFSEERDEEIGDLAAMLMLEFFMEEIGPVFYNLGVEDSHAYVDEKLDDLFGIMK